MATPQHPPTSRAPAFPHDERRPKSLTGKAQPRRMTEHLLSTLGATHIFLIKEWVAPSGPRFQKSFRSLFIAELTSFGERLKTDLPHVDGFTTGDHHLHCVSTGASPQPPGGFVPDHESVLTLGGVLDLEPSFGIGQSEIGVVKDSPPRPFPGVRCARDSQCLPVVEQVANGNPSTWRHRLITALERTAPLEGVSYRRVVLDQDLLPLANGHGVR